MTQTLELALLGMSLSVLSVHAHRLLSSVADVCERIEDDMR